MAPAATLTEEKHISVIANVLRGLAEHIKREEDGDCSTVEAYLNIYVGNPTQVVAIHDACVAAGVGEPEYSIRNGRVVMLCGDGRPAWVQVWLPDPTDGRGRP